MNDPEWIELIGGPLDGEIRAIIGDHTPKFLRIAVPVPGPVTVEWDGPGPGPAPMRFNCHVYERATGARYAHRGIHE